MGDLLEFKSRESGTQEVSAAEQDTSEKTEKEAQQARPGRPKEALAERVTRIENSVEATQRDVALIARKLGIPVPDRIPSIERMEGEIKTLKEKGQSEKPANENHPAPEAVPEAQENKNESREREMGESRKERSRLLTRILTSEILSGGLNLVPFLGGGKMIVESIAGEKLDGKKMDGKASIIHGAIGVGSLVLDFTGVGEVVEGARIIGKSTGLIGKLAAKLGEKGMVNDAKIFTVTAELMAKNPELVKVAEQAAEAELKKRIAEIQKYRKTA